MDCGEGNEEGETRGKREGSPPEKTHCDWLPPRVSTPSPLESLEVGFRFGFVFSRESGFRDYLGLFLTLSSLPHQIRRSVRLLLGA